MRLRTLVILLVGLMAVAASAAAPSQRNADPISGEWEALFKGGEHIPPFTRLLKLKLNGEKVTGTFESDMGPGTIKGSWAANKLKITIEAERGAMELAALLKEGRLVGEWAVSHAEGKWEAKKK